MFRLNYPTLFALVLFSSILFLSCADRADAGAIEDLEKRLSELEAVKESGGHDEHYLLATMDAFQRYMNKLWFAGQAENHELIHFYHHEIEEYLEGLIEEGIEDDGHNLSELAEQMLEPAVAYFEERVVKGDTTGFHEAYLGLTSACNNCHSLSEHSYIRIGLPIMPYMDNQIFELAD